MLSEIVLLLVDYAKRSIVSGLLAMIPKSVLSRPNVSSWVLRFRTPEFQAIFDVLDNDSSSNEKKWINIRKAMFLLDSMGIPHPPEMHDTRNWLSFLAQIIDAASSGDVKRAKTAPVYGVNVARLILQDATEEDAIQRFEAHRKSIGRFDSVWANVAIINRLPENSEEFTYFALELSKDDEDIFGTKEIHEALGIENDWWDEIRPPDERAGEWKITR